MIKEIVFLIVVLLSNIIQCITGFAGTVLAMPFSVMLVGFDVAKPILNILGIVASVYIVAKDYKSINKKEFIKTILIMLVGMAGGFYLKDLIGDNSSLLYKILGSVVILFALINAYKFYSKKEDSKLPALASVGIIIISGIVHGMFVCGGPLLVTYLGATIKDKDEFRSTVSAVWIVLNSIIMFSDIKAGYFNMHMLLLLALSIVVLVLSLVIGNLVYKKMSRSAFLQLTYLLMIISGISLIIK